MIVVAGSLNMDLVVKAPRIPRPGETVLGTDFKQVPGGKGGNQASAAAKLGAEVAMIGCVGDDSMGRALKESLRADGANVEHVHVKPEIATGVAAIIVEHSGNNAIAVAPGANAVLTVEDMAALDGILEDTDILLMQLEVPMDAVLAGLKKAKSAGKLTILNPAPAVFLDDEILAHTDILTPNETELEILSGHSAGSLEDIEAAGKILLERGVREIIVTLGEKGCMHINRQRADHYEAYKVKAVDTTAAGDSFNAALAVSLSGGADLEEAISFAMKVGAMTVTKEGAQTSLPLLSEVEGFFEWLRLQQAREE